MEILSISTKTTEELARTLATTLKTKDVIALVGDLGAGKTFFTNCLVSALGISARVQSPTFVIHRKYLGAGSNGINCVNHLDLYRLTSLDEIKDLGLIDMFEEQSSITIVEWPELAKELLPDRAIWINFKHVSENERLIKLHGLTPAVYSLARFAIGKIERAHLCANAQGRPARKISY